MAGHPLRPATRRRLGEPLPHQLADRPRAPRSAPEVSFRQDAPAEAYAVLPGRWAGYPPQIGRSLTCYAPVRRLQAETRPLDLHVLSTPPAFVLSQDQTLQENLHLLVPNTASDTVQDSIRNHFDMTESELSPSALVVARVNESASHTLFSIRLSNNFGAASAAAFHFTFSTSLCQPPSSSDFRAFPRRRAPKRAEALHEAGVRCGIAPRRTSLIVTVLEPLCNPCFRTFFRRRPSRPGRGDGYHSRRPSRPSGDQTGAT